MSKSIYLNIETQTEDKQILTVCHINEKSIALETSNVANQLFRYNRRLFDKINKTTKITSGVLYRQEVIKQSGEVNRLSVPILDSKKHIEFQICNLFFENNRLKRQQRAITPRGTKFDFDPKLVSSKNSGGFFNDKKLSPDDIINSDILLTVEEIELFQKDGIKTIMISDNLYKKPSLLEVGYRIQFVVTTDFENHIKYVIRQAERSINFLRDYHASLTLLKNYDPIRNKFNEDYTKKVLEEIGIIEDSKSVNLGTQRIKSSEFGVAAIAYYNLSLLLKSQTPKTIYSSILRTILPTNKTSPDNIDLFISKFSSLLNRVKEEYSSVEKQDKKDPNYSRVSDKKEKTNSIEAITVEKFSIEQEKLGYSVFSEKQSGLNNFSLGDYQNRVVSEQTRHYPLLEVEDSSKFLKPPEIAKFRRTNNAPAFLTPVRLVMGEQKISTTRGMTNIPPNDIRKFRLAKSSRFSQMKSSKFPESISKGRINEDSLSSFNITISSPKPALLERPFIVDIDPLKDSKFYVGENSDFATNNPLALLRQYKRILTRDEQRVLEIASDIVPRRFLRNKKAIKSIKEIQFSNKKSKVRKLAAAGELDIESIPPQVKFMMSKNFNPNPESDPLKNRESRQIIEETQKNIFQIRVLSGFRKNELGFLDVYNPIYQNLSSTMMVPGKPMLAKAFDYEVPELGIVKDNFAATIYSNLIYIRG